MPDTKHLVMVASLERHLLKERNALYEALMAQGSVPTGLPIPPVSANYLWKLNQLAINDADYIFLLVGSEYGPLSEQGVGYLHQAYAAARAKQKTVVALIYTGDAKPSAGGLDKTRLSELVSQLKTGVYFDWHNEETLRDAAERAMEYVLEVYPTPGWQRGQGGLGKLDHSEELDVLRGQLDQLRRELEAGRATEIVDLSMLEDKTAYWHTEFSCKAFREGQLKVLSGELNVSWKTVFSWLAAPLLTPISENKVYTLLSDYLQPLALRETQQRWRGCHAVADVKPDRSAFDRLKLQLRSMALIRFDDQGRWRLTEIGESTAMRTVSILADSRHA